MRLAKKRRSNNQEELQKTGGFQTALNSTRNSFLMNFGIPDARVTAIDHCN
jgi:hypothetical protein